MSLLLSASFWLVATVLLYFAFRWLHQRWPRIWLSPMILVPGLLISGLLIAMFRIRRMRCAATG